MMKNFLKALMVMAAVTLASCGGGGSGGGEPNGPSATLRIYPPIESISMPVGFSGDAGVEIRGGRSPYVVTTSDKSVDVALSTDNILYIAGRTAGTSEVVIYDNSLPVQTVKISMTAVAVEMVSSIGQSVNLKPGQTQQFTVRGGEAPYVVSSGDTSVATVSGSGGSYTITGGGKAGTATIRVLDSANKSLDISVTVAVDPLVRNPATIAGVAGETGSIQISGGLAPYTVTSSNSAVVTVSGQSYTLVGAGSATLSIRDNAGQTASTTVTVTAAAPALKVAPATQTVKDDNNATITYQIAGGTKPYTFIASAGDADVATIAVDNSPTTVTGSLTIAPAAGPIRCVTMPTRTVSVDVYDATLAKQTVTLTITHDAGSTCP